MRVIEQNLVARYGAGGFAAIAAGLWGVPLCFFAGGVEFDARAFWGLYVGIAMFPIWVLLVVRARRHEAELVRLEGGRRRRRFEVAQMSLAEKIWALGCLVAVLGIIGWLNAAATVDLGGLAPGITSGNGRILGFVEIAVIALIVMIVAAVYCWTRNAEGRPAS